MGVICGGGVVCQVVKKLSMGGVGKTTLITNLSYVATVLIMCEIGKEKMKKNARTSLEKIESYT